MKNGADDGILLIEVGGEDAGLAVPDAIGVRFYSGNARFHVLDGRRFARISDLRKAASEVAAMGVQTLKGRRGFTVAS